MRKHKTIIFILIFSISISLIVISYVMDAINGLDFLSDNKLNDVDKVELENFYTEYPEIISQGKVLDIKYTWCDESDPYGSRFVFLFKSDKPKLINNLEVHFKILQNGIVKEHVYINDYNDSYEFYESLNYNKSKKLKILRKPFSLLVNANNPDTYKDFIDKYGRNLDINEFKFIFNFTDGTREEHYIVANKEKSLAINSYKLDKTMEEIIEEYKGPEEFEEYYNDTEGDINKLIINLSVQYQIYSEKGLEDIYRFFTLIENSKNKKKVLENERILRVFRDSSMEEFTSEELKGIMIHIKQLYTNCNFDKDSDGYIDFYNTVKVINEKYEELTGNILVPKDFRNYEVDEIFQEN